MQRCRIFEKMARVLFLYIILYIIFILFFFIFFLFYLFLCYIIDDDYSKDFFLDW